MDNTLSQILAALYQKDQQIAQLTQALTVLKQENEALKAQVAQTSRPDADKGTEGNAELGQQ